MGRCLLAIDLVNDFLDRLDAVERTRVVGATGELVSAFRGAGLPIVWVRQEFAPDLSDAFTEMRSKSIFITIAGTQGARFDAKLDVRPDDHVIVKKRYSAFFSTDLDEVFARIGVDEIFLCGVNTHACIRTTAIDAYQRDLSVVIATDAVKSYDTEHAEMSLTYMKDRIATLRTNRGIIETLT